MTRQYRPQVEIAADIADGVKAHSDARETNASALWYQWLVTAVQMVDAGLGHLLPQVPNGRAVRGSRGEPKTVRWSQSRMDFDQFRRKISSAGSNVPAVLEVAGSAYIAAGGDAVAMAWPPQKALPRAA